MYDSLPWTGACELETKARQPSLSPRVHNPGGYVLLLSLIHQAVKHLNVCAVNTLIPQGREKKQYWH